MGILLLTEEGRGRGFGTERDTHDVIGLEGVVGGWRFGDSLPLERRLGVRGEEVARLDGYNGE